MEIKFQIPFRQLLKIVQDLTPAQKEILRKELNEENIHGKDKDDFIQFLINGPVYSESEIRVIEDNRKSIAAWRRIS